MKTTSEACRILAAVSLAAAVAAGCAAPSGLDEQAGSGGSASPITASPATERVVAGIAELVLTTRAWPTFEEARADPVRTVEDGSPLFAYIRATRSLGELAHPSNPGGTYAFSEYPHLFLQVGDVDSLRILSTCYVTLTSEEAGMRELVVPLAPLTFRPGQIPADCWLASVVAGRPGKRTYEVRLAGFAGKFESWLPVPDLLAVAPVPTDLANGAGDYATMLRATPLRSATLVASTAATPAAAASNPFNPAALSPVSPNFGAPLPAQRSPSVPTSEAPVLQAPAPQALAPQAPPQPPAPQPPASQAPLSPARMMLEASPGITPGADLDPAPTASMPTSFAPSPTLRAAPAPVVLTPPPRPDPVILPPTSEPVIATPIPDPVVLTQPLRPVSPAPRPLSLAPAPGPITAAPAPVMTPAAPASVALAATPAPAPQPPEPAAASTFGSGSATSGSRTAGPATGGPAASSPAAYSPAAYSPPAIGAPSLATVAPSLIAPQNRPPALVAINSAPLPGPRRDIGNSRMELQLQTLTSALLGRRPSEAFFMDPQWTSSADPRGRVWQQHAHAAAIFKGASCSWQRIKAFRRPGASGLLDVEPAGEPIEINCSDLR